MEQPPGSPLNGVLMEWLEEKSKNAINGSWRAENVRWMTKKYPFYVPILATWEKLAKAWVDQGGQCVLCPSVGWCADHCHYTGHFRGWLCKECNQNLWRIEKPWLLECISLPDRIYSCNVDSDWVTRAREYAGLPPDVPQMPGVMRLFEDYDEQLIYAKPVTQWQKLVDREAAMLLLDHPLTPARQDPARNP